MQDRFVDFEFAAPKIKNGKPLVNGMAEADDAPATLQLVGDAKNLSSASLSMFFTTEHADSWRVNLARLRTFLQTTVPDSADATDWVLSSLADAKRGNEPSKTIGRVRLKLSRDQKLHLLTVTVEAD